MLFESEASDIISVIHRALLCSWKNRTIQSVMLSHQIGPWVARKSPLARLYEGGCNHGSGAEEPGSSENSEHERATKSAPHMTLATGHLLTAILKERW